MRKGIGRIGGNGPSVALGCSVELASLQMRIAALPAGRAGLRQWGLRRWFHGYPGSLTAPAGIASIASVMIVSTPQPESSATLAGSFGV